MFNHDVYVDMGKQVLWIGKSLGGVWRFELLYCGRFTIYLYWVYS